jgi:hypothetical protein
MELLVRSVVINHDDQKGFGAAGRDERIRQDLECFPERRSQFGGQLHLGGE